MIRFTRSVAVVSIVLTAPWVSAFAQAQSPSDGGIRQRMIEESRKAYRGNCPCPEDRTLSGEKCGDRSAYSRRPGERLCYAKDITDEMVADYLRKQATEKAD